MSIKVRWEVARDVQNNLSRVQSVDTSGRGRVTGEKKDYIFNG